MNTTTADAARPAAVWAASAFAVAWSVSLLLTGAALEWRVEPIPTVLHTLADHRAMFIAANAAGIVAQACVPVFLLGLAVSSGPGLAGRIAVGWWACSIPLYIAADIIHIVMTHVPVRHAARSWPVSDSVRDDGDVLHHLADVSLFIGTGFVCLALAAVVVALRAVPGAPRRTTAVIVVTVAANLLQFLGAVGLDVFDVFGVVGAIGIPVSVLALATTVVRRDTGAPGAATTR